jgi:PH (Pleckstrin Homology) domain-containing protein
MSRVDRLVSSSERIHLVTREHGVVLLRPFLRSTLAVLLFGGGAYELAGSPAPAPVRWAAALLAGVVVAISMLGLLRRVSRWNARRLVVTDRRVLLTSGLLARRVSAVPLHALDDLQIHVSGAGRLLRYGCVVTSANGRRGPLFGLRRLPDPDLVFALLLGLDEEEWDDAPEPAPLGGRHAFSGV